MQLKGKRVSVGAPNSGTEEQADYVLKALGIDWNKDIKKEKLGAGESVAALKDGKIDAFFWSGAVPTGAIIDMASTPGTKMVLLPVGGEAADKIMKGNPGVFHKTVFAKGSYSGVENDVDTIGITAVLQAMDTFPAERLYQIVKAIFDNKAELAAVWKGANENDAGHGRRSGHPGCDQVPASRRTEVLQGEGRAEIDPARKFLAGCGLSARTDGLTRQGKRSLVTPGKSNAPQNNDHHPDIALAPGPWASVAVHPSGLHADRADRRKAGGRRSSPSWRRTVNRSPSPGAIPSSV